MVVGLGAGGIKLLHSTGVRRSISGREGPTIPGLGLLGWLPLVFLSKQVWGSPLPCSLFVVRNPLWPSLENPGTGVLGGRKTMHGVKICHDDRKEINF